MNMRHHRRPGRPAPVQPAAVRPAPCNPAPFKPAPFKQAPPKPAPVLAGPFWSAPCTPWLLMSLAGLWPWPAQAAPTATVSTPLAAQAQGPAAEAAPALLLARVWPAQASPLGFLVSEKFDGVRVLWDGRRLRLRGGGEVAAPASFLARLPAQPLDGELWLGPGQFDALSALVRQARPDEQAWRAVRYLVFELPGAPGGFAERAQALAALVGTVGWPQLVAVPQQRLADAATLRRRLAEVVAAGGEGLVLHRADAPYVTGRADVLFKFKPHEDDEALVIGHLPGRGRLAGQVGALRVRHDDGREFSIGSGLDDAQRRQPPAVGTRITYRYRGLTPQGLPRFASLLRVREAGL